MNSHNLIFMFRLLRWCFCLGVALYAYILFLPKNYFHTNHVMKSYKITAFKFSHEIGLDCFVVLFSDISGTEITHCLLNVVLYISSLFYNY